MSGKMLKISILFVVISLLIPILSIGGTGAELDPVTETTRSNGGADSVQGEYISFSYTTYQDVIIKDFTYTGNGTSYEIFDSLKIVNPNTNVPPTDQVPSEGPYKFQTNTFLLEIRNNEEGEIKVESLSDKEVQIEALMGEDITFGEENLDVDLGDDYGVDLSWQNKNDLGFKTGDKDKMQMSLSIGEDGFFNSSIVPIDPEEDDSKPEPEKRPSSISIDSEGTISEQPGSSISAETKKAVKGGLELDIMADFNGSRVIRLNISKEVFGEIRENTIDLNVSIGEKQLGYVEPWKLHDTEKIGYYLNQTDGDTTIYLKMNFTRGESQTVSVVEEEALQPETSSEQAMTSTYSYLGLAAGLITIAAASVAVFKKDR